MINLLFTNDIYLDSERIFFKFDFFQLRHLLFVEFLLEKQQQAFIFLSDIL